MDAEGKTVDEKQKEDSKKDATVMSELQAWKLMMDSMVKFIQASTRLMNTFNSKANSQMSLESKECEHSLRALLVPTLTALESHRQFKKTNIRPCRSESNSDAEKPIQNIQVEKTGKKSNLCNTENYIENTIKKSEQDLETNKTDIDEENEKIITNINIDVNNNINDLNNKSTTLVEDTELRKEEKPQYIEIVRTGNEGIGATIISSSESKVITIEEKQPDENCEVITSKEDKPIKPISIKLEEAQKEIEALKMEVIRLQRAKSNKVSALYREIMKDSAIDRTLRPSSPKINLVNRQQAPMSLRKAPVPVGCSARSINPTDFRKPRSLATTSAIHSEFQIGSLPGDAGISATEAQRRNVPLRIKPRLTNEMVCLRCSKQRRCLQLPQGYESAPIEIYTKMNHHKPYQKPMYPLYPRPVSPSDPIYNSQRASHNISYQTGQPLHISFEDCGYNKDENLSYSDEASDEYLCESELY